MGRDTEGTAAAAHHRVSQEVVYPEGESEREREGAISWPASCRRRLRRSAICLAEAVAGEVGGCLAGAARMARAAVGDDHDRGTPDGADRGASAHAEGGGFACARAWRR